MRCLAALAALALGLPVWSAELAACSNADAAAILAKVREYSMPAPNAPKHRWLVSKGDGSDGWTITEYSALKVFAWCQPVTKADELNGVQYGLIRFEYEASRTTDWPELTSAGLQWKDWTDWVDPPKHNPGDGLLALLANSLNSRDLEFRFRKYKGAMQLEFDYVDDPRLTLMPNAEVNRFLTTADAEAAALRVAEAERAKQALEQAQRDAEQRRLSAEQHTMWQQALGERFQGAPNPDDFYPPGSLRREEQGTANVRICVDPAGQVKDVQLVDSSGFPDLDAAAVKAVKSYRFRPAKDSQAADLCGLLPVRFSLKRS